MFDETGHAFTLVEISNGRHYCLTLGFGIGKPHSIFQFNIRNINSRFHDAIKQIIEAI